MKPWPKESIMKNMSPPTVIAAAILLGISLAGPTSARAAAPQHHDQVPGFQRLAVGDLEVTSLYDGGGQFEPALAERAEESHDRRREHGAERTSLPRRRRIGFSREHREAGHSRGRRRRTMVGRRGARSPGDQPSQRRLYPRAGRSRADHAPSFRPHRRTDDP